MELFNKLARATMQFMRKLNADRKKIEFFELDQRAGEAVTACSKAMRRLTAQGKQDSDTFKVEQALQQVHHNDQRNAQYAYAVQGKIYAEHNTKFWKTARWFRDWVY